MAKGENKGLTPMMAQYQSMRRSLPDDVILLFRLGDFYEMFFEDAKTAAGLINVALTKRHNVPMCGVPHHAAEGYIAKLIGAGKRVAIGDQTSTPVPGQLVDREVTRIISAGTVSDLNLLDQQRHNYLAAVFSHGKRYGLACADHSTGEFGVSEFDDLAQLEDELERLAPSELIIADDQLETFGHLRGAFAYDAYSFLPEHASMLLRDHFAVQSLDGFGCEGLDAATGAAGAILHYLVHQLRRPCDHLRTLSVRDLGRHVLIDSASQRNLDLVESRAGRAHTLLGVIDRTCTPMGARLLRDWLLHPLRDIEPLLARQEMIAGFLAAPFLLSKIRESLRGIRDIERTTSRLSQNAGNARDIQALSTSLALVPNLKDDLSSLTSPSEPSKIKIQNSPIINPDSDIINPSPQLTDQLHTLPDLTALLTRALVDEPPAATKDGGIIRDGYSAELDELRAASHDGKSWISKLQQSERERTGIDSLKIKFNNVFGYFIEITKSKLDKVPDDYRRKQTMANAERYITPELKEMEHKVLGAEERSQQLEYELFTQLRDEVAKHAPELQETAAAIAEIDSLAGLAEVAQLHQHCRPTLEDSQHLEIVNGRHPVLEQTLVEEKFVPNDTAMDPEDSRLQLVTGPNMAGKSTYIRQVALITILAQIGACVPAESAIIGLADRVFCRVGASDDISRGQSTFMVEMSETALIVNNATDRSLVILDEIGRGTATFDGLSIAWAVAEHLHDEIGCRTLFATHYHELTDLAETRPAVANFNVAVREWNEEIIFLRKILPGSADKSYGIQVARLAGLPKPVIDRAKAILSHLELHSTRPEHKNRGPKPKNTRQDTMPESEAPQLDLGL